MLYRSTSCSHADKTTLYSLDMWPLWGWNWSLVFQCDPWVLLFVVLLTLLPTHSPVLSYSLFGCFNDQWSELCYWGYNLKNTCSNSVAVIIAQLECLNIKDSQSRKGVKEQNRLWKLKKSVKTLISSQFRHFLFLTFKKSPNKRCTKPALMLVCNISSRHHPPRTHSFPSSNNFFFYLSLRYHWYDDLERWLSQMNVH